MGSQEQKQHFSVNLLDWYMGQPTGFAVASPQQSLFYMGIGDYASADTGGYGNSVFQSFYREFSYRAALAEAPEEDVLKNWEGLRLLLPCT